MTALLNVPRSLLKLLQALKTQGYTIPDLPADGEELIQQVQSALKIKQQWKSLSGSGINTLGIDWKCE